MKSLIKSFITAAVVLTGASPLAAQLPNTSAAATALGGNYTARARGFEALSWNPALLAAPDRPRVSFGTLLVHGGSGLDPIDLGDLAAFEGRVIPAGTKAEWLAQVRAEGRQRGDAEAGVTPLAFTVGGFGFQYGISGYGAASLNDDAVEAMLYGNAGETGEPKAFGFEGSEASAGAFSTVAVGYGRRLPLVGRFVSVGATAKYILGHGVARGADGGSRATADTVRVEFPVVYSDTDNHDVSGRGIGIDLGAALDLGRARVGVSLQNVVNTFAWDESTLLYAPASAYFDGDSASNGFEERPYAEAPASLREAVADERFTRRAAIGAVMTVSPRLTVSADARASLGDGISIGPRDHAGVGAEYRALRFLPIRAGIARVTDAMQYSGGLGLRIGSYELGVGMSLRTRGEGQATGLTVNLVSVQ